MQFGGKMRLLINVLQLQNAVIKLMKCSFQFSLLSNFGLRLCFAFWLRTRNDQLKKPNCVLRRDKLKKMFIKSFKFSEAITEKL